MWAAYALGDDMRFPALTGVLFCALVGAPFSAMAQNGPSNTDRWSGVYIGGVAGYAGSNSKNSTQTRGFFGTTVSATSSIRDGRVFGAVLGFNKELGETRYLIGLEADVSSMDRSDADDKAVRVDDPHFGSPRSFQRARAKTDFSWLSTIRGRFGETIGDSAFVYGTGGLAFGDLRNSEGNQIGIFGGVRPLLTHSARAKPGWTAGGGVERALIGDLSVRAEALYFDLKDTTLPLHQSVHARNDGYIARIGIDYRFHS